MNVINQVFGEGATTRSEAVFILNDFRDRVCGRGISSVRVIEKRLQQKGSLVRTAIAEYIRALPDYRH